MAGASLARKAAFDILMAVERGQAHSDDLLRGRAVSKLSDADRHLATTLVLGVLRWQIALDEQLRAFLKRPNGKLDPEILITLRLGAFQLLHLDRIPARAAIDESVELAKQAGHRFASGMVNAVLRKCAVAKESAPSSTPSPDIDCVSASAAHPHWLVERWNQFFGADAACAVCRHDQIPPATSICLTAPEIEADLAEAGITLAPGTLLTAARTVLTGDVTATAAFREGRIRIQDEGSQLVAEIAAQAPPQSTHAAVNLLDCCAAPGGKTLILAGRHLHARIVACESSAPRLEQLRKRLAPLGDRVECILADATKLAYDTVFDLALADVPCSGTGTLSRNPEIRHRLHVEELPRQAERQRAILSSAIRAIRPGGHVVYSTCSLEPEENELVISATLAENENVRALSFVPILDKMKSSGVLTSNGADQLESRFTPGGYLRLLPGAFGTDGFFVALIEKQ